MTHSVKRGKAFLNSWELAGTALLIVFVLRMWFFFPAPVLSSSMDPSLRRGEWVLIVSYPSVFYSLSAGDVVVLRNSPSSMDSFKRIVSLPGSSIPKEYSNDYTQLILAKDDYFVMGDNLPESIDSRHFGPVSSKQIKGKAWLVFWPPNSVRWAQSYD
jgi:signal peptidase I